MNRTKTRQRMKQPRPPRLLDDRSLSSVPGGRLDNAPINVVSDYNPDTGGVI
jgi:hypothetical protein